MQILKKIAELTKPYWPRVFGGIVLSLMVSGLVAAMPLALQWTIDNVFVKKQYEYLIYIPPGILALYVTKGFLSFAQAYLMRSAGMKLVRETRNRMYNHVLCLPVRYFGKESSGIIISRVMNDVENLKELISTVIRNFTVAVPSAIFLLGVAFYKSWKLSLIILVLIPFLAYSAGKFGKRVKKKRKAAQRNLSFLTQKVGETILGARIIKVFNREETMGVKFEKENRRYYREMLRVVRFKEFIRLINEVISGLGIAAILWFGGSMVVENIITPGDFGAILFAIGLIFPPLKKISDSYTTLQETRACIERVDKLFDAGHEEQGEIKIDGFRKSLVFDNVSFGYHKDNFVLNGIDLEIKHGEVLAIVGKSGAGKSTLVDLIPRFYKVSDGMITIDDIELNKVDLHSLRELTGIVSQDIILFNDTIRENIAFGREGASESEIVEAAKLAFADEFIKELPGGYDTEIGERGLKLSGGQRQRIAIARAILKNPPILILDEATSSLDTVSEALVQKALEKLMKGRTTIVIAHRLSTIKNADRIIILDKGKIADSGTHEQLLSKNDIYMKLYNALALS
ncbi:MAG: ABC transporter ATP-binding protein [Nitrospirota bacterium]